MKSDHQSLIEKKVPVYLKRRADDAVAIIDLLNQQKWEDLFMMGHQWKGSGPTFGLNEIGEMGVRLEIAANEKSPDQVQAVLKQLQAFLKSRQ